jgi:DNA-binding NtrC family response regulator
VVRVVLPPLRARPEDVPMLSQHFVHQSCKNNNLPAKTIGQTTLRVLMAHPWPGNIRQLENALEHAVVMSAGALEIQPEMLPEELRNPGVSSQVPVVPIPDEGIDFSAVMSGIEKDLLVRSLEKTGGNKRQAARLLNLSRTTLIDKVQRLGIGDTSEE